jgi:hypothetical protein
MPTVSLRFVREAHCEGLAVSIRASSEKVVLGGPPQIRYGRLRPAARRARVPLAAVGTLVFLVLFAIVAVVWLMWSDYRETRSVQLELREQIEKEYAPQIERLRKVAASFPVNICEISANNEENRRAFASSRILAAQIAFQDERGSSFMNLSQVKEDFTYRHARYHWYLRPQVGRPVVNIGHCEARDGRTFHMVQYEAVLLDRNGDAIGYRLSIEEVKGK